MTRHPIRRTGFVLLSLLLPLSPLSAEDEKDLRELLRDALYTEEVTRDPEAAAKQYEALLSQHDAQRAFAASALFRLAEVRRKQDRKDEAIALYQKLLDRFPEAQTETKLARENLAELGAEVAPAESPQEDDEARELRRLQQQVESSPDRLKDPELLLNEVRNGRLQSIDLLLVEGAAANPRKLLEEAVKTGNLRTITRLLDHPFEGPRGLDGALFLAITLEYSDVTKLLLARGANPNSLGMYRTGEAVMPPSTTLAQMTPLHVAVRKRDLALCKLLLEHKADPNRLPNVLQLESGRETMPGRPTGTALHDAVVCSLEVTRLLLEHGADVRAASPQTGFTPLHSAMRQSHLVIEEDYPQILKLLVEKGADLEAKTAGEPAKPSSPGPRPHSNVIPGGTTPLMLAVLGGNPAAARWLVDAGASTSDRALLDRAIQARHGALIRLLVSSPKEPAISPDTFLEAVRAEDADILRLLVNAGADPSARSPKNETTPLQYAAGLSGDPDLLHLLIELGAKPDADWLSRNFEGAQRWNVPPLYRRFLVPQLQEKKAVTLIMPSFGTTIAPVELVSDREDTPPLALASLLLRQRMNWPCLAGVSGDGFPMLVTIFRKNDGQAEPVSVRLEDDMDLPALKRGDVVELAPDWERLGGKADYNIVFQSEIPPHARWHLMRRVSFPVTVELDGKSRPLTLRGDRLVFDPGSDVVPLVGAAGLAELLWRPEVKWRNLPWPSVAVVRTGWPEIKVSWNPDYDFALKPGDKVIIKTPELPGDLLGRRKRQVTVAGAGLPFVHCYENGSQVTLPTLIQALANLTGSWAHEIPASVKEPADLLGVFSGNKKSWLPVRLLPHPDYSKIVIRRLGEDGHETRIAVDLASAIVASGAEATTEAARKADVPLQWGDVVEIPQIAGKAGTPWQGPSAEERRFFAKALDCRVQVVDSGGVIDLREIHYEGPGMVEMAGQWIPVTPATGTASLTAGAALHQHGETVKVIRQAGGSGESTIPDYLFLRDGDVVEVNNLEQPKGATPASRPPRQRTLPQTPRPPR